MEDAMEDDYAAEGRAVVEIVYAYDEDTGEDVPPDKFPIDIPRTARKRTLEASPPPGFALYSETRRLRPGPHDARSGSRGRERPHGPVPSGRSRGEDSLIFPSKKFLRIV